ncbi:chlorophyllase-2-like [Amphibalanus amphitrite]|uniref:chlorophyllase-2-like n=1 Tax=Amphibalanus amphitrite TaxID=1232801 RepID=UPI001C91A185|nr:chlorophyllase-2-like [Amphibalanus amphitrite]XP_043238700.1 chlorophyllase-2-like [Amphibalanus amphitrite]
MVAALRPCALLAALAVSGALAAFDPYVAGPYTAGHLLIGAASQTGLPTDVSVYVPDGAAGNFPVIIFLTEFQDTVPAEIQEVMLQRVASHGFLVITPWSLTESGGPTERAIKLVDVMAWIHSTLPDYITQNGFPGAVPDFERTTLLAHSAGSHVAVSYLEGFCEQETSVKSLILMSPVDGFDPFGIVDEFCIVPGQRVNFTLPALVLTAGLDAEKGSLLYPACAPADLSNDRFYNAFYAPRWQINATQYGHGDFLDDEFWALIKDTKFCAFCSEEDCANRAGYRDYQAGQIVSFAMASTDPAGHCDQLQYIEDPALMPVATVIRNNRPADVCSRFMAGCARP